jgi:two-component system OmpR family sensor kinase
MTSIRGRLIGWFTVLLAAASVLGGGITYWAARQDPDEFFDDQLRQVAITIADVRKAAERIAADSTLEPDEAITLQVWDAANTPIVTSPAALPRQSSAGFHDIVRPGGTWRTFTVIQDGRTTQASQQIVLRHEFALNAAWPAVLFVAFLIPVSWLLVRWLVGRILRPLAEISKELGSLRSGAAQPLRNETVPDEIRPLVEAIDLALARLTRSLDLNRRFVSDAAHQLRTPLTALRLQVQNLERHACADQSDLLSDIKLGLERMSDLTRQLLSLARTEASGEPEAPEDCDLRDALADAIEGVRPLAEAGGIGLSTAATLPLRVAGDRRSLVTLFSNLVDNAVRYTPPGGEVRVEVAAAADKAVVTVADTGPGLPEDMLERVFDRFVRHEPADNGGTGLGLPIARAIAGRCLASVTLSNRREGTGLVATIRLVRRTEPSLKRPAPAAADALGARATS